MNRCARAFGSPAASASLSPNGPRERSSAGQLASAASSHLPYAAPSTATASSSERSLRDRLAEGRGDEAARAGPAAGRAEARAATAANAHALARNVHETPRRACRDVAGRAVVPGSDAEVDAISTTAASPAIEPYAASRVIAAGRVRASDASASRTARTRSVDSPGKWDLPIFAYRA